MQSQESVNVKVNKPSQSIAKYVKLVSQSNKRTGKEYLCRLKQFEEYCISVHNFRLDDLFISKSKTVKVDIYELLGGFVSYLVDKNCYSNLTIKYRVITARTLLYLRQQAQQKLKTHIEKTMPEEYQKGMVAIDQVLRITWGIVSKTADERVRLQALALIDQCNSHKMDMVTNGAIVSDALKYVNGKAEKLVRDTGPKQSEGEDEKEEQGVF